MSYFFGKGLWAVIVGAMLLAFAQSAYPEAAKALPCGTTAACVLSTPPEATPLVLLARTYNLSGGQATISVTEALGGLQLTIRVLNKRLQPDPNASVRVYATGHFGSRGLSLARVSPGVFATMANLADVDELAVRVSSAWGTCVLYVGLPGCRLGARPAGPREDNCPCHPGCAAGAYCPLEANCRLHQANQRLLRPR